MEFRYPIVLADVSKWNGRPPDKNFPQARTIDWYVMADKLSAAYIKCSDGNKDAYSGLFYDPAYAFNVVHSGQAGIPRGLYHYVRVAKTDIKKQLEYILDAYVNPPPDMNGKLMPLELPPALDFEDSAETTKNSLLNLVEKAVIHVKQQIGKFPVIYTRTSWWDQRLYMAYTNVAYECPLWLAQYNLSITAPSKIPQEWARKGKTWSLWQFTADGNSLGPVYGCPPPPFGANGLDLNYYNGSVDDFEKQFGVRVKEVGPIIPPSDDPIEAGDMLVTTQTLNPRGSPSETGPDLGSIVNGAIVTANGPVSNHYIPVTVYLHENWLRRKQ